MVKTARDAYGFIDGFVYLSFTFWFIACWRIRGKGRQVSLLTLALAPVAVGFALGTGNFGGAIRHRFTFTGPLLALMLSNKASMNLMHNSTRPNNLLNRLKDKLQICFKT